ncbi:MAG: elongation factor P maturation arginine rhamnosyltransferase EarP [Methylophilaceae bacterium]
MPNQHLKTVEFNTIADYAHIHMESKQWDIFCKIVDNYGDIGVCWRLAKQLHNEHGLSIRLFVSDLAIARDILVGIDDTETQQHEGVTIVRWDADTDFSVAAAVVLETFACDLPAAYLAQMTPETVWVNIDHLSAESWVSGFHALHGKHQETNLIRHFYFPGFKEDTGGLLREEGLITQRDAFQQSEVLQNAFWQSFGIENDASDFKVSLFSYSNTPIDALLDALVNGKRHVSIFMPFNDCLPKQLLGNDNLAVGDCLKVGKLTLHILPFLTLDNYDKLLWACDVNFVRGEESWVRALWAAKPFIWQPYLQTDNAHLVKLNAFLKIFYDHLALDQTIAALHQAWSVEEFYDAIWDAYLANLAEITEHTQQQSSALIQQEALVPKLMAFCANLAK